MSHDIVEWRTARLLHLQPAGNVALLVVDPGWAEIFGQEAGTRRTTMAGSTKKATTVKHLAPLAAATFLLISGAYSYAAEETVPGTALLAAGLISLGAWLALEAAGLIQNRKEEN